MRVLALVTDGFGAHGGIARYNCDLMTALAQTSVVEQIIVVPRYGAVTPFLPAKIDQMRPARHPAHWSARAAITAFRERPDVVFCGHLNSAPVASVIARLLGRPLWVQVHGIEAWSDRGFMIRRAVENAHLVTSVSRFTRHKLLSWTRISPARVRVLPNTLSCVYEPRQRRRDLMEHYRLQDRKVILTVGRMAAGECYKGHDRILRCLARVRQRVPEVSYLIVGAGDDQSRLAELTAELALGETVIFAGTVSDEDLPDHYALADVFAMPSNGEGFGIVFLEAAACGLHVIGGNRDGSVDPLAEGAIGLLVDPYDENALTAALIDALCGAKHGATESVQRFAFGNFAHHVEKIAKTFAH